MARVGAWSLRQRSRRAAPLWALIVRPATCIGGHHKEFVGWATLKGFRNTAHLPMVEQPELVLPAIDRFLNGQ